MRHPRAWQAGWMYSLALHRVFHVWHGVVRCRQLRAWVHQRVRESQARLQSIEGILDRMYPTTHT